MTRRLYTDAELIAAVGYAGHVTGPTYSVTVLGRMSEHATYRVEAPTKPEARRIAREYASRIDRETFRFTSRPTAAQAERL
jgi:hypothetical protein